MKNNICESIDKEIMFFRTQDPLRNWGSYFRSLSQKMLSQYKTFGKFKMLAFSQYTDRPLSAILKKFIPTHSFVDYDFNDATGEIILRNRSTGEFEVIYIGDQCVEILFEVADKLQKKEVKGIN